jgi:hypothetical protein
VRHRRHYTLAQAEALLPWVADRLAALRSARDDFSDEDARRELTEGAPGNGGGTPGRQVGEAYVTLQTGLAALEQREIVLRDLDRGLIDFPSFRDGREVYLCWVDGEQGIGFWHELDAGFAGRQEIDER